VSAPVTSVPAPASGPTTAFWPGVRLVARREFVERIRERSFLISTVVSVVILCAVVVLPKLLSGGSAATVAFQGSDATALAAAVTAQAEASGVDLQVVDAGSDARQRALDGDLSALVDGTEVISKDTLDPALAAVLDSAHRQVVGARALAEQGIDAAEVSAALDVPPLDRVTANEDDPRSDQRRTLAFVATVILYGQIIGYGFWVATGVVEEKSSRVVEVLLATIRPRVLLTGKIIGIGVLGLVQLLILGVAGLVAGRATGGLDIDGETLGIVGIAFAWFLLGYAFFASLFAAAAARVSRQEDVQNVTTPITMVLLASFFAGIYASNAPDSSLTTVLSIVPPFSALVNPPRIAAGAVPGWQVGLAVLLMLLVIVVLVRVAARLYEGAVLRTGAKVGWREAWQGSGR
jgi:ABC-2 type transport system permease protein